MLISNSPSGSRMTCALVGVQDDNGNYEGIFVGSAQGKNLRGSLEGGAVQEYDPVVYGVGVPIDGELHAVG